MKRLSVIGLGKLGLPMALCFANKGFDVIGVDSDQDIVQAINDRRSPIYEPGVDYLMGNITGSLVATQDYKYAVENSDITFIVVPTPTETTGGFSTKYVEAALQSISRVLRLKASFHLIVITSTVLPGAATEVLKPIIESVSGKKCGEGFGLCYSPEFIALGSVVKDFRNPDVVLIGESEKRSGEILADIYQTTCDNKPSIVRTSIYNAELAKISLNAFVTMKISFANALAEICERLPGGDVDAVSEVLGHDSRIGRKYLTGGLAFGGPCFPRDNKAFAYLASKLGCKAILAEASDKVNRNQISRIIKLIEEKLETVSGKSVAILGLTYKTNTDVIEVSASIEIGKALLRDGAILHVYDPAGIGNARRILGKRGVRYCNSIQDCLRDTEFCVIATPWEEIKKLKPEDFIMNMKAPVVLDCWRIYNRIEFSKKLEYFAVGLN
jgi:UDPglucose 6-dehydrogenase